jgi:threonine dehydrogenase-like Zn-dependent dehydrogenase
MKAAIITGINQICVENVEDPKCGDREVIVKVTVDPSLHCGECFFCKRARGNLCLNWGQSASQSQAERQNMSRPQQRTFTSFHQKLN